LSIIKAALGICETKPLSNSFWSVEGNKVRVKLNHMAEPLQKGKSVYLKGKGLAKPVLLLRTEDDIYLAFSNCCTHFGHRKLDPVPGEPKLRCCSVNHSTFDLQGKPIGGPAKRPLKCYAVERSDGDLVIALSV
jgi:nitrite reductase/ring-hydroxylating ferredoxin subunit